MLDAVCARARRVLIGIGSSNRYDLRNPFTAEESAIMIRRALAGRTNFELFAVPDLGDPPRWRAMVRAAFGPLDAFVCANRLVAELVSSVYPLRHPLEFVPPARRVPVDGTRVRLALARGEDWESLVPPAVADFMKARRLPERFRREFGLETLAAAIAEEEDHVLLGR